MSRTYNLSCNDHRQTLWVGQSHGTAENLYIYSTEEANKALSAFLASHVGCPLQFLNSQDVDTDYQDLTDYEEA